MAGCGCGKKKSAAGLKVEADQKAAAQAKSQQNALALTKRNPVRPERRPVTASYEPDPQ